MMKLARIRAPSLMPRRQFESRLAFYKSRDSQRSVAALRGTLSRESLVVNHGVTCRDITTGEVLLEARDLEQIMLVRLLSGFLCHCHLPRLAE
jgi:hypothetical protein